MFTKKHYKAIAEIIREEYHGNNGPDGTTTEQYVCRNIASGLAGYFATDNPLFDRKKFMIACGLEE